MGDREVIIQQLFQKMQVAERNKDLDPKAQREARVAQYRESQGESWVLREEDRLGKEADERIAEWRRKQEDLKELRQAQKDNVDLVNTAENTQVGLQEDVMQALDHLKRMVQEKTDAKRLHSRNAALATGPWQPPPWLNNVLDGLIVILLLQACFLAWTKWNRIRAFANLQRAETNLQSAEQSVQNLV